MKTTLLLAFSLTAGAAYAQQPGATAPVATAQVATAQVDARFANWLGCWRLEDDLAGTGARMCVTPDNPGVRLKTIAGRVSGGDEGLRADGVTRPITDKDCKGTERSEWSRDGQRLFRQTEVACGTDPARKVSSIAFLTSGPAWINVQLVEGGPDSVVRVQRYRRATDQTLADGTRAMQVVTGARPTTVEETLWNVDDVIEASAKAPAEAVQAAVAEAKGRFDLNKKSLVALADAGVSEQVIDLMIGLAFPQRFVVERRGSYGSSSAPVGISMGGGYFDPFMSPIMFGSSYANCYGASSYGYRSYYSSCGSLYSPYSTYGYGFGHYDYNSYGNYYPNGSWVTVNPGGATATQGEGRVVNGRGYTQVRPRESEPTPVRTGSNGNGNGSSAGWSGASSGGSNGVSSQGYSGGSSSGSSSGSSGSSGDSGARTAVPRPPGGAL